MLILPTKEQTFSYIVNTHDLDRISCPQAEVNGTYTGKFCNPYVDGHLRAFNYIFTKLLDKDDFPCKSAKTPQSLSWLKEIHSIMLSPLLTTKYISIPDEDKPPRSQIGTFRIEPATNVYSLAPDPKIIHKILYNWLEDVYGLHQRFKEKAKNPTGLTRKEADLLNLTAYNSLLMMSTVQPFAVANNRMGRLVENIFRLQWRLPFRVPSKGEVYDKFIKDLTAYQQNTLPQMVKKAQTF